ncbi:MAG: Acetyltransferase [Parcubacteria bacterium C7867-007]|nr:MAG: Acetyltransferase [Parcubacteria bacterium C7867-007]
MSTINIRRAEERDLEAIGLINGSVFLGDRDQFDGAQRWATCWFNAFPLYQYFVVEEDDVVVGYAGWQLHGGFHRAEPVIELDQIGILPAHQGKGLAPRLIQECMQALLTWTKESNDRIESHLTFVVWAYALNFNAVNVYAKYFTDGVSGLRTQFGARAENMLRIRIPIVRPIRIE